MRMNIESAPVNPISRLDQPLDSYVYHREEILNRVRRMLIACLDLRKEPDEIDPDTVLFGSGLGLDSVDNVEIVISLEVDFGVKFADADARRRALRSVNAIVDAVLAADKESTV
jgi:acyl carrier protein